MHLIKSIFIIAFFWVRDSLTKEAHSTDSLNYDIQLEFLKIVVAQDRIWEPVLRQRIQITVPPPHHNTNMPFALIDVGKDFIDPLKLIERVLGKYNSIGSFVNYGVHAVKCSFTCLTLKHLSLYVYTINLFIIAGHSAELVVWQLKKAKNLLKLFLDQVAYIEGKLKHIVNVYWQIVKLEHLELEDNTQRYPDDSTAMLMKCFEEIQEEIQTLCSEFKWPEYVATLEVDWPEVLLDPHENTIKLNVEQMQTILKKNRQKIGEVFHKFKLTTGIGENWDYILDFETPIKKHIEQFPTK